MRSLLLAFAVAFAGCQSPGGNGAPASSGAAVNIPGDHALRVGQSLTLPDRSTLAYIRLVADSRCRPDVQCIRAGDADIELRWNPAAGTPATAVLNSDPANLQKAPNAARFGRWQVTLKALDWKEPPTATLSITRAP